MANKFSHNIDTEISLTYIFSQKKLTLVAAIGVTIGIALFIFMNCTTAGFVKSSDATIFKSTPHLRVYKDDDISQSLTHYPDKNKIAVIVNPKVVLESDKIVNPNQIVTLLRNQPEVTIATPQVYVDVFYNNGRSQISGNSSGVIIADADHMFNIQSTMVEGNQNDLKTTPDGILLGVGIAEKMSVKTGDIISITSSKAVTKVMKVVGLFKTSNSNTDKTKSYINIAAAQQLLIESSSYVTDIDLSVDDFEKAPAYAAKLSWLAGYKAEDWKEANETQVAQSKLRSVLVAIISLTILIVSGFGIYNVLNMTINQKINDIAILKAIGFQGRDVIRIFVLQALLIGVMGVIMGLAIASTLVYFMQKVWIGGDIGFFPITFDKAAYIRGILFGTVITFVAGYLPAKKAANVDPVSIFRK